MMMQQLYVGSSPYFIKPSSITVVRQMGCYTLPLIHLPLLLVYLLQTITFHTIRLILCYSKPVSLTTSLIRWGKVLSLCYAGLRVACNTCVMFPSSFWFDNLGL